MRLKAGKTDKTEKRQPDSKTQTSKNSRKNNREFTVITYAVLVLFVCMMGYFAYFQFVKSEDFINSPYNKRQDLFARKVTRGEIISADGHILAETITDTDGQRQDIIRMPICLRMSLVSLPTESPDWNRLLILTCCAPTR